jgi:hypothetical protein
LDGIVNNIVFKDIIKDGYRGYNILYVLGDIINLLDDFDSFNNKLQILLNSLEDDKTYTFLSVIRFYNSDSGVTEGLSVGCSIKVNNMVYSKLLSRRLIIDIKSTKFKYNLPDSSMELLITGRVWLSNDEFKVKKGKLPKVFNEVVKDELKESRIIHRSDMLNNTLLG